MVWHGQRLLSGVRNDSYRCRRGDLVKVPTMRGRTTPSGVALPSVGWIKEVLPNGTVRVLLLSEVFEGGEAIIWRKRHNVIWLASPLPRNIPKNIKSLGLPRMNEGGWRHCP